MGSSFRGWAVCKVFADVCDHARRAHYTLIAYTIILILQI
jgi:hypothetical protein